jgi:DNA invertase Pin-like site-specific DNA recombinase
MATFAYGRVSTKDQTTDNQRLEIENAGHKVDFWFADTISGKTSARQRPQFAKLLEQIRDGETLVVSKLDRLGRDAQDVGATVKLLATRKISVIVLQLGKLDLASPAGKMMLTMLAAVAEMERDLLVERTQSGLARAKSEGKTLGRPSKTTPEQRKEITMRQEQGESVSALARLYGVSRASILAIVNGS